MLRASSENDRGYALVSIMAISLTVGALLTAVTALTWRTATSASSHRESIETRRYLEAALNRMIFAYMGTDDPLRAALAPDGITIPWIYMGRRLDLSVQAESGKWDLNAGDLSSIVKLLDGIIKDEEAKRRIIARLENARQNHKRISSVGSLLDPIDRMTERGQSMSRYFTTLTDQRGIDPLTAPLKGIDVIEILTAAELESLLQLRKDHQPFEGTGPFVSEKPIYTFRAQTLEGFDNKGAMEASVMFSNDHRVRILSWRETNVTSSIPSHHFIAIP